MRAGNGFSPGMDRFALDAGTAERLLSGAVDVDDAPPQYSAVAATLLALQEPPESGELVGGSAAAGRIAEAIVLERTISTVPRSRRSPTRARIAAASIAACGLFLTGGLAATGALPGKAQGFAAAVLRQVGISVPDGDDKPAGRRPPVTTSIPAPTTAPSVGPNPVSDSPDVPPPPQPASPTPPLGTGRTVPNGAGAGAAPAATVTGDGNGHPPGGAPRGNAYGIEKGNAYAKGKNDIASGNANGNGNGALNGNGNAGGNANSNANAAEPPHANGNAGGNGNGHANGQDRP